MIIITFRVTHIDGTSLRQYFAPIVLGKISDKTKIAKVIIAEAKPK